MARNFDDRDLEQKKMRVLVSNNAQTILDELTKLINYRDKFMKRWLWELLQNAKDSVASGEQVRVKIGLAGNQLVFMHSGSAFSDDEIIHLIYHGSTKKDFEDMTGKFGTGFLTTHLLSRQVWISGLLESGQWFNFCLDRRGDTVQDIYNSMERSWQDFLASGQDIIPSSMCNYTTRFQYELDEQGLAVALKVIDTLQNHLSFVLAVNQKFDTIELSINGNEKVLQKGMSVSSTDASNTIEIVSITQNSAAPIHIALSRNELVSIAAKVRMTQDSISVEPLGSDAPRLFADFPLFGTEDFNLPVVVNSTHFKPNMDRDGLALGTSESNDVAENKRLIEDSFSLMSGFIRNASSSGWKNLATATAVGMPGEKYEVDSAWYNQVASKFVDQIISTPLIDPANGVRIDAQQALFPVSNQREEALQIWQLATPLWGNLLPRIDELDAWISTIQQWGQIRHIQPDHEVWGLTVECFAKRVSNEFPTLASLDQHLVRQDNQVTGIAWLNSVLRFFDTPTGGALLETYCLLPNQEGVLVKRAGLYIDDSIDADLKDLWKLFYGKFLNLLDRRVPSFTKFSIPKREQETILSELVAQVKKNYTQGTVAKQIIIGLWKWLVQHDSFKHLEGFPVYVRAIDSNGKETLVTFSGKDKLLIPVDLWPDLFKRYAEIFPQQMVLSSDYYDLIDSTQWKLLGDKGFVFQGPIYSEDYRLSEDEIGPLLGLGQELDEAKEHTVEHLRMSQLAYLDLKDRGIIDRARQSKKNSSAFVTFLLNALIEYDNAWQNPIEVDCKCGVKHLLYPVHWLISVKTRQWVHVHKKSEIPSSANLASLIDETGNLLTRLLEPKPSEFLSQLGIGVGDLTRNVITKGDNQKKIAWDRAMGVMLKSELTPEDAMGLLREPDIINSYKEKVQARERSERNKETGALIESAFKSIFQTPEFQDRGFGIERTGVGSDFVVEHDLVQDGEEKLLSVSNSSYRCLIELKGTSTNYAAMSSRQGSTAVENSERFALCVVPLDGTPITEDSVRHSARFVIDIGKLLKRKVSDVEDINEMSNDIRGNDNGVEVDITNPQIKYKVSRAIWGKGLSFDEFARLLIEKSEAPIVAQ